jgi:hypothetical protein
VLLNDRVIVLDFLLDVRDIRLDLIKLIHVVHYFLGSQIMYSMIEINVLKARPSIVLRYPVSISNLPNVRFIDHRYEIFNILLVNLASMQFRLLDAFLR